MTYVGPGPMCFDQVIGMRTKPKPAFFTALNSSGVTFGLPHAVSPSGTSKLLPRFQPILTLAKSSADVCVNSCGETAAAGAAAAAGAGVESCAPVLASGGVRQALAKSGSDAAKTALGGRRKLRFTATTYRGWRPDFNRLALRAQAGTRAERAGPGGLCRSRRRRGRERIVRQRARKRERPAGAETRASRQRNGAAELLDLIANGAHADASAGGGADLASGGETRLQDRLQDVLRRVVRPTSLGRQTSNEFP